MTCIIACIDEKGVGHMAGDSAGTNVEYHTQTLRKEPKVFRNGEFLFGFTSSFRMGQILQYEWGAPERPEKISDMAFMVTRFIPSIRDALVNGNFIDENSTKGGSFIVIYRSTLYEVQGDYQIFVPSDDFTAVGSGAEAAASAYFTLQHYGKSNLTTKDILRASLEAAAYRNITVAGRLDYINTNGPKEDCTL